MKKLAPPNKCFKNSFKQLWNPYHIKRKTGLETLERWYFSPCAFACLANGGEGCSLSCPGYATDNFGRYVCDKIFVQFLGIGAFTLDAKRHKATKIGGHRQLAKDFDRSQTSQAIA